MSWRLTRGAVGDIIWKESVAFYSLRCIKTYAIDPLWVEKCLIDVRRAVVPLPFHVKVVTALQRNGTARLDFIVACSNSQADLTSHTGTTNDGLVEAELLDEGRDEADIPVLGVGVHARPVVLVRERPAVCWKINGSHLQDSASAFVVEDAVVLASIAASCMEEDDFLAALAGLFVEHFRPVTRSVNMDSSNIKAIEQTNLPHRGDVT